MILLRFFMCARLESMNDRNKWIFNKVQKSPGRICAEAKGYIEAFNSVHDGFSSSSVTSDKRWVPPLPGWVKMNCDAFLKVKS